MQKKTNEYSTPDDSNIVPEKEDKIKQSYPPSSPTSGGNSTENKPSFLEKITRQITKQIESILHKVE